MRRKIKSSEPAFVYQITKKGPVVIKYEGKQIKIVKDRETERLIAKIKVVEDNQTAVQLLFAKITGNFKRGNEKIEKIKESNLKFRSLTMSLTSFYTYFIVKEDHNKEKNNFLSRAS